MTRKTYVSLFLAALLAAFSFPELWADSLEFGHVRARTRGWVDHDTSNAEESDYEESDYEETTEAVPEATDSGRESDSADDDWAEETYFDEAAQSHAAGVGEAFDGEATVERKIVRRRAGPGVARQVSTVVKTTVDTAVRTGRGFALIGRGDRGPDPRKGYLVLGPPPPLRFSDLDPVDARPPAPALPEFSFTGSEYEPYLIEAALPEDAMNDPSMLSEIVIELEPHEVVSGKIDTRILTQEEKIENFNLDEPRSTVLRPEEVLIYFETDTNSGRQGAVIPFAPAQPSTDATIKSSATLKKE